MSIIIQRIIKVHKDPLGCDGGDNLGLKTISLSVREDADQEYFREEKKYLSRADHSGYPYYDQAVLIMETAVEESLIALVSSTVRNTCWIQDSY